ncbi:hypothetical protein AB0392_32300 [Nonomuraea angiospora]|uniref:hypothetical protein n=1 Tax=Nonomuraea angiospora TaxID=46172 RepID=UPI00344E7F24
METSTTTTRPPLTGRSFCAYVAGNNRIELEEAALREARDFFGDDIALWVSPEYVTSAKSVGNESVFRGDGKYGAVIDVYEIDGPSRILTAAEQEERA